MTITEKAAYLKGLVEGKGLDPEAGEGKLWHVLSELVSDMAAELTELREDHEDLADSLEEVEVGVSYLEELLMDDYDDYDDYDDLDEEDADDGYYPFGNPNFRVVDDDVDGDDDGYDSDLDDGFFYEVECPSCGEAISFDEDTLEAGSIQCPSCGATLEFDTMELPDVDELTDGGPEDDRDDE